MVRACVRACVCVCVRVRPPRSPTKASGLIFGVQTLCCPRRQPPLCFTTLGVRVHRHVNRCGWLATLNCTNSWRHLCAFVRLCACE